LEELDEEKYNSIISKLKGEKQREHDLKTIAEMTEAQNKQNYSAQITALQ
jgi:hypothetical protein